MSLWCHQMETFSALLALCEGNPPVTGWFPSQSSGTISFDVSFDLRLNKHLNKIRNAGNLRRHRAHFDVSVMVCNMSHDMGNLLQNGFIVRCFVDVILLPVLRILKSVYPNHDDVIKWKHFPRYWPFVRGIHRSPVNSPHKGQWRRALMFSLIYARINSWVNNREAGDLRRHPTHCDVIVMPRANFIGAME